MVDPVDPDMSITVARILEASGYSLPGNAVEQGSLATISKGQAVGALGVVTIVQYNALGEAIETWTLWNAFVTEAKFGDLEYGSDDLLQLDLTLQYDWARIEVEGKSALNGDSAQAAFNIAGS